MGRYDGGWDAVRAARYRKQVELGVMPPELTLSQQFTTTPWSQTDPSTRREYARKMAVYAGMLDNVDQHIGRLRAHLKQIGELDNTVFIVMSDNGADGYELSRLNLPFRLWYMANKKMGYDAQGGPGSYVHYGQNWAQVSNTPLTEFKGTSHEGGMRVPFIVNWPGRVKPGAIKKQFAFVTDFLPTVLDIAGIPMPGLKYHEQTLHQPKGASLLPLLEGKTSSVHEATRAFAYEGTGGFALYRGDFKLMGNATLDGGKPHLFNLVIDPTESHDLAQENPDLLASMQEDLNSYFKTHGVVQTEPGYDPLRQLLKNNWQVLVRQMGGLFAICIVLLAGGLWCVVRLVRRA